MNTIGPMLHLCPCCECAIGRKCLVLATCNNWEIHTFDFNGAYLNGELNVNEDIFMQPPPGYESQGEFIKHLHKSLYGLKQAGRKWYDTLCCALTDLGFSVNNADPGVFYAHINNHILILAICYARTLGTFLSALWLLDCLLYGYGIVRMR